MTKNFQIGSFCFSLSYPPEITPPPNFMLFEKPDVDPEYSYRIFLTENLPSPPGTEIAKRMDIRIFLQGNREHRLIGVKGRKEFYACYQEKSDNSADIFFDSHAMRGLNIDPVFCSLLALERRMVKKDALILHCAYTKYKGEAILFSAPSETGKTTQANLWKKHRKSETINGDRALLQCIDGRWMAQGWPVCGTSDVCHNFTTPIRAIVMLSQAKQNHIERLTPMQAFSQLYSQITVNTWNRDFVQKNIELVENLCLQIPVYHLGCTISESAVICLEQELYPQFQDMKAT